MSIKKHDVKPREGLPTMHTDKSRQRRQDSEFFLDTSRLGVTTLGSELKSRWISRTVSVGFQGFITGMPGVSMGH